MAEWAQHDDGTLRLHERNCAICQVARECLQVCGHELALFRKVLPEAEVRRESHIMAGARACTYVIVPKNR